VKKSAPAFIKITRFLGLAFQQVSIFSVEYMYGFLFLEGSTMQRLHLHKPGWIHVHKPDWHAIETRLDHLIHDPRFWAGLVLAVLFAMMILTAILTKPTPAPMRPIPPMYPYLP
jgi:hypothetical protein